MQLPVESLQRSGTEMLLGDPWLIRDDNHGESHTVQPPYSLWDARQNAKLLNSERRVDDAGIFVVYQRVNYAITIQEHCLTQPIVSGTQNRCSSTEDRYGSGYLVAVISSLTVDASQKTIPGRNVKHDLATFKLETKVQFA